MKKNLLIVLAIMTSVTITFAQMPSYVPTTGLLGWWGFNGNANDASINGNNGIVNGATLTTDRLGNTNGAYSFNGVKFKSWGVMAEKITLLIKRYRTAKLPDTATIFSIRDDGLLQYYVLRNLMQCRKEEGVFGNRI